MEPDARGVGVRLSSAAGMRAEAEQTLGATILAVGKGAGTVQLGMEVAMDTAGSVAGGTVVEGTLAADTLGGAENTCREAGSSAADGNVPIVT